MWYGYGPYAMGALGIDEAVLNGAQEKIFGRIGERCCYRDHEAYRNAADYLTEDELLTLSLWDISLRYLYPDVFGFRGVLKKAFADTREFAESILSGCSTRQRAQIAKSTYTCAALVSALVEDEDQTVAGLASKNMGMSCGYGGLIWPNLEGSKYLVEAKDPRTDLRSLIEVVKSDGSKDCYKNTVLRALARNPGLPEDLIERATCSKDATIRANAAINLSTPVELLEKLSKDCSCMVLHRLAQNPFIGTETQMKCAGSRGMRRWNEHLCREQFVLIDGADARYAVASNLAASDEVIERLAKDERRNVRRRALSTQEVQSRLTQ